MQRRVRKFLRSIPIFGSAFCFFERKMLLRYATERYDAENPAEAHEYFNSYADWVLCRIGTGRVLDLGCGYGFLTKSIADKSGVSEVFAIDKIPSGQFKFLNHPKITYQKADITLLETLPRSFDAVVATEFIEHIQPAALEKLLRLIKITLSPNGIFMGSTPEGSVASGSPFHVKEYERNELKALLQKHFNEVHIELLGAGCLVWQAAKE